MSEKEKKNREEVLLLMRENPDLPIVPMVTTDLFCDEDIGCQIGRWDRAIIGEYLAVGEWYDHILFKGNYNALKFCDLSRLEEEYGKFPEEESERKKTYDNLPWVKAIIVYIGVPTE